jgi:hypothetical protein
MRLERRGSERHMPGRVGEAPLPTEISFTRVRTGLWVLLGIALVIALALPLARLWHDATAPLQVRAYVMPATPRVGVVTQLVIDVADAQDRAAIAGSWAQLAVQWDMAGMHMTVPPVVVAGDQRVVGAGPVFVVALLPSMAGEWRATMTLRTPGRPTWQGVLEFGVLSS